MAIRRIVAALACAGLAAGDSMATAKAGELANDSMILVFGGKNADLFTNPPLWSPSAVPNGEVLRNDDPTDDARSDTANFYYGTSLNTLAFRREPGGRPGPNLIRNNQGGQSAAATYWAWDPRRPIADPARPHAAYHPDFFLNFSEAGAGLGMHSVKPGLHFAPPVWAHRVIPATGRQGMGIDLGEHAPPFGRPVSDREPIRGQFHIEGHHRLAPLPFLPASITNVALLDYTFRNLGDRPIEFTDHSLARDATPGGRPWLPVETSFVVQMHLDRVQLPAPIGLTNEGTWITLSAFTTEGVDVNDRALVGQESIPVRMQWQPKTYWAYRAFGFFESSDPSAWGVALLPSKALLGQRSGKRFTAAMHPIDPKVDLAHDFVAVLDTFDSEPVRPAPVTFTLAPGGSFRRRVYILVGTRDMMKGAIDAIAASPDAP